MERDLSQDFNNIKLKLSKREKNKLKNRMRKKVKKLKMMLRNK